MSGKSWVLEQLYGTARGGSSGASSAIARGPSGAGGELERGELGGSSGAIRSQDEKVYPDVGGGVVEPHRRGEGIDWSEEYPYKGTETIEARARCEALKRGEFVGIGRERRNAAFANAMIAARNGGRSR